MIGLHTHLRLACGGVLLALWMQRALLLLFALPAELFGALLQPEFHDLLSEHKRARLLYSGEHFELLVEEHF